MAFGFRKFFSGINIVPKVTTTANSAGDLDFSTSNNKLNLHNGVISSPIVTEAGSGTLSNKSFQDTTTIIIDSSDSTKQIKFDAAGTTGTSTTIQSSQTANRVIILPDSSGTLITTGGGGPVITNALLDDSTVKFVDTSDNSKRIGFDAGGTASTQTTISASQTANRTISLPDASDTLIGRVTLDQGANRLQNKDLDDSSVAFVDDVDPTKKLKFQVSGVTTATTRTLTVPDLNDQIVTRTSTDTGANRLQNKEIDSNSSIVDSADPTKRFRLDPSGNATGTSAIISTNGLVTSRVYTLVDVGQDARFILNAGAQDIDGSKTFTQDVTPTINAGASLGTGSKRWNNILYDGYEDRGEIATPANPSASRHRVYFKSDGNLYTLDSSGNERQVGSGSGSSGTNFVTLNTAFQSVNSDNSTAESAIGSWITYADAPGVAPVDMTGGSATSLTLSRTTTVGEVLDGTGSFKIVKTATNAQGQGTSVVANIPLGFRGKPSSISMLFKVISGTLVSGDLKFYVYDITNSQVITPFNNDIVSTSTLQMTWDVPSNCEQVRIGFHFTSTSTSALTFSFDDVSVSDNQVLLGSAMSDWQQYTPIFTGFGTVTSDQVFYRRVGDSLELKGLFTVGTGTATEARMSLPVGLTSDSSKTPSITVAGEAHRNITGVGSQQYVVLIEPTVSYVTFGYQTGADAPLTKQLGSALTSGGAEFIINDIIIPINSWSTGVINSNSNTFQISNILANGTNVTSAPTILGQYRTLIKDNAARTFSDDAPGAPPSGANGMHIYSVDGAGPGVSGQTNRWEIFIGKNKQYEMEYYQTTGRSGRLNVDFSSNYTGNEFGLFETYDPTSGVLTLSLPIVETGSVSRSVGYASSSETDDWTLVTDGYFDVIVSESILPVQSSPNTSEIWVDSANGYGSINNKIRRYSNLTKNIGSAITYADSATLGSSFTINEDGLYSAWVIDFRSGGATAIGISVNSTELTTVITSVTNVADVIVIGGVAPTNRFSVTTPVFRARRGDIIRPHDEGQCDETVALFSRFKIIKVGN